MKKLQDEISFDSITQNNGIMLKKGGSESNIYERTFVKIVITAKRR